MTDHYYIHIPFCRQRCPYCKFALTPVFDEFKKRRYIEYLKKEINTYFDGYEAVHPVVSDAPLPLWGILSICQRSFREFFKCSGVGNTRKGDEYRYQKEPWKIWKAFVTFCQKVMGRTLEGRKQKTIYFGGGTPSVLSHDEILSVLECFPFYRGSGVEITMEMNPEDVTSEYITGVLALGINRISLGIQTLNETSLAEIHRSDRETILGALEAIGSCIYPPHEKVSSSPLLGDELERSREIEGVTQKGIPNSVTHPNLPLSGKGGNKNGISLNIDFILGLPFVKPGETLAGIRELHEKFPYITHTSVYMLEDEKYPKHWRENSITEIEMQSEFLAIMEYLDSLGWHHYELSNWARPGYESVHNQAYWDHSNSRGFGLSSASYEGGQRWNNSSSFTGYYEGKKENEETLTPEQIEIEKMMFGLRRDGWQCDKKSSQLDKLISDGLLEIKKNKIKPTKTGIFVIDHILSELI